MRAVRRARSVSRSTTTPSPAASDGRRSSSAPGERHRGANEDAERRPHRRPPDLPDGPPREPARPTRRELLGHAGQRHARCAEGAAGGRPVTTERAALRRASPPCSRTPPPAAACSCSCCSAPSGGERFMRCRPATARRWSRRTCRDARHGSRRGRRSAATVTLTHTIGVFALGLVTLALSQYVLPEQLYPWLTLVSGLMVVGVGAGVLRSRFGRREQPRHHHHHHAHDHEHVEHARAPRHGRRRRPSSLPVRARRAARRHLAARGRARDAPHRRLQPRPRRHAHRARRRRRPRAAVRAAAHRRQPARGPHAGRARPSSSSPSDSSWPRERSRT